VSRKGRKQRLKLSVTRTAKVYIVLDPVKPLLHTTRKVVITMAPQCSYVSPARFRAFLIESIARYKLLDII
jgi:hypothetical protein